MQAAAIYAEMNNIITVLLFTLAVIPYLDTKVEGTGVFLKPSLTNVILGKAVTLECYTYESMYSKLSFIFHTHAISAKTSSVMQLNANGGIRRTTTFTMTADLNATQISCYGSGAAGVYNSSRIVEIFVQAPPNQINDVDICKLGRLVFFSWNPVFALAGINVSYIITDNHRNMTIYEPRYSLQLDNELDYKGNITVVFNASAFGQVAYSKPRVISHLLNDTNLKLDISSVYLENKDIKFNFTSRLSDLNECSFNKLTDEKLIACNHTDGSTCKNYSASVHYQETNRELTFSSTLDSLRQKFNSSVSFDYFGAKVETDNVSLSTHLIQNLNFTQRCANVSILGDREIPVALYFQHKSGKELIHRFNVSKNSSLLCSPIELNKTHIISISAGVGNWSVYVYDTSVEEEQRQPAVESHNLNVTVNDIYHPPEQTASSSFISTATKLDVLLVFCLFFWLII